MSSYVYLSDRDKNCFLAASRLSEIWELYDKGMEVR